MTHDPRFLPRAGRWRDNEVARERSRVKQPLLELSCTLRVRLSEYRAAVVAAAAVH